MSSGSTNVRAVVGGSGSYTKVVSIANAAELAEELAPLVGGGGGGAHRHEHSHPIAEKKWKITHSLGSKLPDVILIGDDGFRMYAPANYKTATLNYIEVDFDAPTSGLAILTA